MEILIQSLQIFIDENHKIMSIPDSRKEMLLYGNLNQQSFTNNDAYPNISNDLNIDYNFFNNQVIMKLFFNF